MSEEAAGAVTARPVLTVRELNEQIAVALQQAFPRTLWVRGGVQRLPHDAATRQHR